MASRPQLADLDFLNAGRVRGLQDPALPQDAATKAYVDAAAGGGNSLQAVVDFGAAFTDKAQLVLTGLSWVSTTSVIVTQIVTPANTDPDEMRLIGLRAEVSDIVDGIGFTLTLYSEQEAKGSYTVNIIGI